MTNETRELVAQLLQPAQWQCIFEHQGAMRLGKSTAPIEAAATIQSLSERTAVLEALQRQIIAQYRTDLSSAHAEICKLQKLDPATHTWPDWSPQANTLRWFDTLDVTPQEGKQS